MIHSTHLEHGFFSKEIKSVANFKEVHKLELDKIMNSTPIKIPSVWWKAFLEVFKVDDVMDFANKAADEAINLWVDDAWIQPEIFEFALAIAMKPVLFSSSSSSLHLLSCHLQQHLAPFSPSRTATWNCRLGRLGDPCRFT